MGVVSRREEQRRRGQAAGDLALLEQRPAGQQTYDSAYNAEDPRPFAGPALPAATGGREAIRRDFRARGWGPPGRLPAGLGALSSGSLTSRTRSSAYTSSNACLEWI
ncbi:hypothetical protein GUJ93_ZPchr0010g11005 [Zizania palustris]|uniref:Uncharacterized protein n=1 Tax=Zizania palustris TaxID=103762 RepID=A0A8J6BI93_ZIZPA|nr:hypothetical protein GUJ93_ZPchr0010g11005 [Zizania palustris]